MSSTESRVPIVECVALTKVFQDFWGRDKVLAVDRLDMEIQPGEVFGLLGPNGSGKSTTIKMLLGLLYPTSGVARVFGRPPTDTAVKSRIGFMPEESYLYRYLNAYETLDYYGRLFKLDRVERRRRTEQLIEMVGLKRAGKRSVGTYSKGMARRIGLAQALINDPDLLILDEPTTGLDPVGTRQIKDVIETLGQRGKTILLCSHLLADVEDVCDRVAIMYGGRRQALGAVAELLERRDVTEITVRDIDDAAIEKVRKVVREAGSEVIDVHHPTDRLEALFLRVVTQAQREKLQTSGAESGRGVSEFLGGKGVESASLIDSLVQAGQHVVEAPAGAPEAPHEAPRVQADVVEKLRKDVAAPAVAQPRTEPVEAPIPPRKPDKAVLDRLLSGGAAAGDESKPASPPNTEG
ncbi:MAG: ABC transporter ATP-binding protein [Planctomycetota bacterium]|nr:MAG: ABC transporter ATP-binding protein [Planctomycetota bacterium]